MTQTNSNASRPAIAPQADVFSTQDNRDFNVWASAVKHQMLSALKRRQATDLKHE
jgi:hypothetical protein